MLWFESTRTTAKRITFLIATSTFVACSTHSVNPRASVLEEEARSFMAGYGAEFARGDGAAVADRYSRSGAYLLDYGGAEFMSHADLVQRYRGMGPSSNEWRDLSFEVVGGNAVSVVGTLVQGPVTAAYSALLVREEGLRIRVEHESFTNTPSSQCGSETDVCDLPLDSASSAWFVGEYRMEGPVEIFRIVERAGQLQLVVADGTAIRLFHTAPREMRIGHSRGTRMIFTGTQDRAVSYLLFQGVIRGAGRRIE